MRLFVVGEENKAGRKTDTREWGHESSWATSAKKGKKVGCDKAIYQKSMLKFTSMNTGKPHN